MLEKQIARGKKQKHTFVEFLLNQGNTFKASETLSENSNFWQKLIAN